MCYFLTTGSFASQEYYNTLIIPYYNYTIICYTILCYTIYIERERDLCVCTYIYIYIYIYVPRSPSGGGRPPGPRP